MSLVLKGETTETKDRFPLPEEGARPARLSMVIDLGTQLREPYKGTEKAPCQQLILGWDLVDDLYEDKDGNLVPMRITTGWYPLNVTFGPDGGLSEMSKLYKIMNALDPKQTAGGDITQLVGTPCLVNVKINNGTGEHADRQFANYGGVSPVPSIKGFEVKETDRPPVVFDFDNPTKESYLQLNDRTKETLSRAVNYPGSALHELVASLDDELQDGEEVAQDDVTVLV